MSLRTIANRGWHLVCALALAVFAPLAQALPVWQLNTAGSGLAGAVALSTLDVTGVGFVQILPDPANPYTFTFVEYGAYRAVQADGSTPFGGYDLTIRYNVTGSGSFLDPGNISFSAGSVELYSDAVFDFATAAGAYGADNGTLMARLAVLSGGTDASGLVTLNAAVVAGSLLPGYLFGADGTDLASAADVLFSLGIHNQVAIPDDLLVSEIVCGMAGYTGAGCDGTAFANSALAFTVRDGGYASVSVVPEPPTGSLALAALGLLGAGARRGRRQAAGREAQPSR